MMQKLRICAGSVAAGCGALLNGIAGMAAYELTNYFLAAAALAIADFLLAALLR